METFSTAELLEMRYLIGEYAGLQFQYWLALSFALIIATHQTGGDFSRKLKACLVTLYVSSSVLFLWLVVVAGGDVIDLNAEYRMRVPSESSQAVYIGVLRFSIWFAGTIGTTWYLLTKESEEDT